MKWIAPTERDQASSTLEKRLWETADQFRANSELESKEYSTPVLGLIFLRFAEVRFTERQKALEEATTSSRRGSRVDDPSAYHEAGVLYLSSEARYDHLLHLPEAENIGARVNDAMLAIEKQNPQLSGILPKNYNIFESPLLKSLFKKFSEIPVDAGYDAFGRVYEFFLGEFAKAEGQGGGEYYTPSSIVRLITEILEPYHGRILDPACGSGGMFVQSARFVAEHQKNPARELGIYGVEKRRATTELCRMNLSIHGLEGTIKQGISYYDDPHDGVGQFDFVLANPPFNVDSVDKERLSSSIGPGRRYPFGLPRTDNANYLWIQLFHSALSPKGRAGFVMANSASDARSSEQELRRQLIESRSVDVMVSVGPNMFYTVTLPCTLWFFDKGKATSPSKTPSPVASRHPLPKGEGQEGEATALPSTSGRREGDEGERNRANTVLFIDARHIYRQIDRAHRDWTEGQVGFLANLVRLYRGEQPDYTLGGEQAEAKLKEIFGSKPAYGDIPGLCKAASLAEIETQGWSLNPGRYVGVAPGEEVGDEDFKEQFETLNEELTALNAQARELEATIAQNVIAISEA